MRILIIGSRGYIARRTAEAMTSNGWEVIRLSRRRESGLSSASSIDFDTILFEKPQEIALVLEETSPDVVVNLSNFFTTSNTHQDVDNLINVNCVLVGHLAEICSASDTPIIHVASAWQSRFSDQDSQSENIYSLYKDLASEILEWYCRNSRLRGIQLVLHDTYGPADPRMKIVTQLVNQIDKETPLSLSGGNQLLELVHVQDVATAIMASALRIANTPLVPQRRNALETFWCLPSSPISLKDLVSALNSMLPMPLTVSWGLREYRKGEKFSDSNRSEKMMVPGWKPEVDLRQGLEDLVRASRGLHG
jgi:CDP-3, 6-dideoxy-D-glycero-L-glycero-4-hexulose-4-reductase